MDVDYLIQPQGAAQGLSGRVLHFAGTEAPKWLKDYLTVDPDDLEDVRRGIRWATDLWADEPDAVTIEMMLYRIFGEGLVEVDDEQ